MLRQPTPEELQIAEKFCASCDYRTTHAPCGRQSRAALSEVLPAFAVADYIRYAKSEYCAFALQNGVRGIMTNKGFEAK